VLSTHLEDGIVDHAIDFNQSNSGNFNGVEGDTFVFSALSTGIGQTEFLKVMLDGRIERARGAHSRCVAVDAFWQLVRVRFTRLKPILTQANPTIRIGRRRRMLNHGRYDPAWRPLLKTEQELHSAFPRPLRQRLEREPSRLIDLEC
jgi:hypothetical protein